MPLKQASTLPCLQGKMRRRKLVHQCPSSCQVSQKHIPSTSPSDEIRKMEGACMNMSVHIKFYEMQLMLIDLVNFSWTVPPLFFPPAKHHLAPPGTPLFSLLSGYKENWKRKQVVNMKECV